MSGASLRSPLAESNVISGDKTGGGSVGGNIASPSAALPAARATRSGRLVVKPTEFWANAHIKRASDGGYDLGKDGLPQLACSGGAGIDFTGAFSGSDSPVKNGQRSKRSSQGRAPAARKK